MTDKLKIVDVDTYHYDAPDTYAANKDVTRALYAKYYETRSGIEVYRCGDDFAIKVKGRTTKMALKYVDPEIRIAIESDYDKNPHLKPDPWTKSLRFRNLTNIEVGNDISDGEIDDLQDKFDRCKETCLCVLRGSVELMFFDDNTKLFELFKFNQKSWYPSMRTGAIRTLMRYLHNLFRGSEFDYYFEEMVKDKKWVLYRKGFTVGTTDVLPGDVVEIHKRGEKVLERSMYERVICEGPRSVVLLYLKFFANYQLKSLGKSTVIFRHQKLFDADLLWKMICC